MRLLITVLGVILYSAGFSQTAAELNEQAKNLLTKGNYKNAVPLLKQAAEMGQAEAQYNYGYCFQQGVEVKKNDSIANIWLLKSAKQGWLNAQFKIAYSYAVGRGCTIDMNQAFYWSLKCAEQNDPECMNNVIGCYLNGTGVVKNPDNVFIWTVRLASLPDVEDLQLSGIITGARKSLAIEFRDGNRVPANKLKSYMWFLIYNESKRDFSVLEQQNNIDSIKELERTLTLTDRDKAKADAEKQIGRRLMNLNKLYTPDM